MNSSPLLINAENVSLVLRGKTLLENISLKVAAGDIVTIVGPNGAGKSTLLRVLLGLLTPTTGMVHTKAKLRIGYMPQKISIDHTLPLTVKRFLQLARCHSKKSASEVLSEVGATSLAERSLHVLSGGEMQRVLLARALLCHPDLLVLDEPVQGVDINGQRALYELIADIRNRWNCGILLVSHDLHFVFAASDQVICLNQHICCAGRPEAVIKDPQYAKLFGDMEHLAVYAHHHDHQHDTEPDEAPHE